MGVDPIEQKLVLDSDPSSAGMAVFAKLDEYIDGGHEKYYQFDDPERGIKQGDPVDGGATFVTNRFVCTYLYRPLDPIDFFEHFILTAVYYGANAVVEKNRSGGLFTYLATRNYELYKMDKPNFNKNYKGQQESDAITATEGTIDEYFGFLTTLSCKWWNTIDHPDLLEQLLSMNYANKGKRDLGVAAGWALKGANIPTSRFTRHQTENEDITHYIENYV